MICESFAKLSYACCLLYEHSLQAVRRSGPLVLFVGGVVLLEVGMLSIASAQHPYADPGHYDGDDFFVGPADSSASSSSTGSGGTGDSSSKFDTSEIREAICELYGMMHGSFGGLLTAVAGAGAIVAGAFGAYRAGFAFIVVAIGSFAIDSLVGIYFGVIECS